ncbi:MAG: hypothetical protein Q7R30_18665 [Acidobacteriota bacterium]|nr:hypothetical protein [Acidobacteriota bacterium]
MAIFVIFAVVAGLWWLLRSDGGSSRVDRAVERYYWVDGAVVVEPGSKTAEERFTLRRAQDAEPLGTGCYTQHFQLRDGSVIYSLIDCDFKSPAAAVYHWRPGSPPRELHKVTPKAEGEILPTVTLEKLGSSNAVLISEDGKEPILFDATTERASTLTLAGPELVKAANPNATYEGITWDWFKDFAFDSDEDGSEIIYTRCSGDRDVPQCATFRQSVRAQGTPDLLRGPAGQAIVPLLRRGSYLFSSVGGPEVSSIYRHDLQSLSWRPVASNVVHLAFSPDGNRLAFSDLHPNVWVLTYNEANGAFEQPRRITNFPAQQSDHNLDLAWLNNSALVVRVTIDSSFSGGWRADLQTGSLDLLWQPKDATQDVFFEYVRKQKGTTTYNVKSPRTTLVSEQAANLIAKASLITIGVVAIAVGWIGRTRRRVLR